MQSELTPKNLRFWDCDKGEDRAQSLSALGAHLWNKDEPLRNGHVHAARLYGDIQTLGMNPWSNGRPASMFEGPTVSHNVVSSICDTWTSLACLVPIRPTFLTNDGAYDDRQRAKAFQKLTDAAFHISGFRRLETLLLRDAGIFGTARVKWYAVKNSHGKWVPKCRRVLPGSVMFDEMDSVDGNPTFCVERLVIDRGRLAAMFPKHKKEIATLVSTTYDREYAGSMAAEVVADMVEVWEGWHLRSGPDATDGVHTIACGDLDLTDYEHGDDEWIDDFFPLSTYHYSMPQAGVHGTGIAARLTGRQYEINRMMMDIQDSTHMMAVPRMALPNGSQILTSDVDDSIGSIVPTSGDAPVPLVWPAYSQDVYAHLHWLIEQAYALEGYSIQDATGAKAPGLNSGAAQRAYADIVSKRHAERMIRREEFNKDAGKQIIALMRRCAVVDPDFGLTFKGKFSLEHVKWKEANLDDDAFEIQCFSASALPLEPAARIQTIQEYVANEWITKAQGKQLAGIPDLESVLSMDTAPFDNIEWRLNKMLTEGEYIGVDGLIDLNAAMQIAAKFYQKEEMMGAPESGLRLVRQFMADVAARANANAALAMAPGGGNPAAMAPIGPGGVPMPPPPPLPPPGGPIPGGMPPVMPGGMPTG